MAVKSVFASNKNMLLTACSFTFNAQLCCHTFSLAARYKTKIPIDHELANVYSCKNNFELFVLVIDSQGEHIFLDIRDVFQISLVDHSATFQLQLSSFETLFCSFLWGQVTHFFHFYYFFFLQRTASIDDELSKSSQPQLVAIGEQFDFDKLIIIYEGIILCSIPQQSIVNSIVALLSLFYIFNMWFIKTAKPCCLSQSRP